MEGGAGAGDAADVFERLGWNVVVQLFEFFDVRGGKQIGAGAHELAQLAETGSQLLQGTADPCGIGQARFDFGAGSSFQPVGNFSHAVLDEYARNQAKMANAADTVA